MAFRNGSFKASRVNSTRRVPSRLTPIEHNKWLLFSLAAIGGFCLQCFIIYILASAATKIFTAQQADGLPGGGSLLALKGIGQTLPPAQIRIAILSTYPPQLCGIGEFATEIYKGLTGIKPDPPFVGVLVVDAANTALTYGDEVKFIIRRDSLEDYLLAARFTNEHFDVVICEHEFGIFGGYYGDYLFSFLRALRLPLVVTLHTVLKEASTFYKLHLREVLARADHVTVIMPSLCRQLAALQPSVKCTHVPHGVPAVPTRQRIKDRFPLLFKDRRIILSAGLIGPSKGLDLMVQAMEEVARKFPAALYIIVGKQHPGLRERYARNLQLSVLSRGVQEHVKLVTEYPTKDELEEWMALADIVVLPYIDPEQVSSGTLSMAMGLGAAVIASRFRYSIDVCIGGEEGDRVWKVEEELGKEQREWAAKWEAMDEGARREYRKKEQLEGGGAQGKVKDLSETSSEDDDGDEEVEDEDDVQTGVAQDEGFGVEQGSEKEGAGTPGEGGLQHNAGGGGEEKVAGGDKEGDSKEGEGVWGEGKRDGARTDKVLAGVLGERNGRKMLAVANELLQGAEIGVVGESGRVQGSEERPLRRRALLRVGAGAGVGVGGQKQTKETLKQESLEGVDSADGRPLPVLRPEVFSGKYCRLVARKNSSELASALLELLTNSTRHRELKVAAWNRTRSMTWPKVSEQTHAICHDLVASWGARDKHGRGSSVDGDSMGAADWGSISSNPNPAFSGEPLEQEVDLEEGTQGAAKPRGRGEGSGGSSAFPVDSREGVEAGFRVQGWDTSERQLFLAEALSRLRKLHLALPDLALPSLLPFLEAPKAVPSLPHDYAARIVRTLSRGGLTFSRWVPPSGGFWLSEDERGELWARDKVVSLKGNLGGGSLLLAAVEEELLFGRGVTLQAPELTFRYRGQEFEERFQAGFRPWGHQVDNASLTLWASANVRAADVHPDPIGQCKIFYTLRSGSQILEQVVTLEVKRGVNLTEVELTLGADQLSTSYEDVVYDRYYAFSANGTVTAREPDKEEGDLYVPEATGGDRSLKWFLLTNGDGLHGLFTFPQNLSLLHSVAYTEPYAGRDPPRPVFHRVLTRYKWPSLADTAVTIQEQRAVLRKVDASKLKEYDGVFGERESWKGVDLSLPVDTRRVGKAMERYFHHLKRSDEWEKVHDWLREHGSTLIQ